MPRVKLAADKYAAADFKTYINVCCTAHGINGPTGLASRIHMKYQRLIYILNHPDSAKVDEIKRLNKVLEFSPEFLLPYLGLSK